MHDLHLETQESRQAASALFLFPSPSIRPERREAYASSGKRVSELAHDARNLISALDLYCELLASPGVLTPSFQHYAQDLRRLAGTGARLIEALASPQTQTVSRYPHIGYSPTVDGNASGRQVEDQGVSPNPPAFPARTAKRPFPCLDDVGLELVALEEPLRALAGPGIRLEIECAPCAGRVALNSEELLRMLFNLVANAVEAMAATPAELRRSPFIRITAQRGEGASFVPGFAARQFLDRNTCHRQETVMVSVRDNGPGIARENLARIFDAGFSTRKSEADDAPHGLGLAIVRELAASAGGAVRAISSLGRGARFDIELPVLGLKTLFPRSQPARPPLKEKIPNLQQIPAQIEKEA